ncbi:MAG: metal-dependent transcriptional regulator [Candidatus Omnitrophica bacterium]|jgi:DtxR family Mn-dependent transcriptional regulator|nr:metal-dependent transcriptional regulator [Candidatus Omnitrophota bacterium]
MGAGGKKITSNMEDYLEAVNYFESRNGFARVSDIAARLGVKKSSVNTAFKNLAGKGMLKHERYGSACLTAAGKRLACELQDKEDMLFRFLTEYLFIDHDTAREESCKLEHSVSGLTLARLSGFFSFIEKSLPSGSLNGLESCVKRIRVKKGKEKR